MQHDNPPETRVNGRQLVEWRPLTRGSGGLSCFVRIRNPQVTSRDAQLPNHGNRTLDTTVNKSSVIIPDLLPDWVFNFQILIFTYLNEGLTVIGDLRVVE
ncbi:hypothetical protein OSB04_028845 [Centaurea solstitialis]|uniref:Uncharacterized protein n=1 Tax=Centaurea solstitialis TaxID=347529 RepID=A0AA38SGF9_9ASTR|nr:hypothetical protein OSB04_028845 [Centaurea solstitialis]